jgi:hypothetical protein
MSARTTPAGARRLAIAGRVTLAMFGSYGVAGLATALLAIALPGPRAEAVSAATLASFLVMAAAVIWVFAARTLTRAALGLGTCAAVLAGCLWWAGVLGGSVA